MEGGMHGAAGSSSIARRRPRESETESQKIKREKAAERQRRKRERDRKNAGMGPMAFSTGDGSQLHAAALQQQQQAAAQAAQMQQAPVAQQQQQQTGAGASGGVYNGGQQDLTPEEMDRRDRVRAAARERQRKHRLLVKQRRMRDLGLDMGNEIIPGMDEVHYRATADGQYHQVLPEMQQQAQQQQQPQQAQALPAALPPHEPPFPQGTALGGQTFASTLLLSFSCAPLLKQHLLRTLCMTNEELASLEPIIAEAWDRWDHQVRTTPFDRSKTSFKVILNYAQRRVHYAEQVAKNGTQAPGLPPPYGVELTSHDPAASTTHTFAHPSGPGPADPTQAAVNEFRARFHRSIIAPAPFRTAFGDGAPSTGTAAAGGAAGASPTDAIDPHLAVNGGGTPANASKSKSKPPGGELS